MLITIAIGLTISVLLYGLHRLAIRLEDRGYIYYRKKSSGGGCGGVFMEVDKLTRPSIEYVVQALDHEAEITKT